MRMSQLLLQTLREAPTEARTPGYQLLLRGGYLRPVHGGFAWLPMGTSVRQRVEDAICRLLRARGGQVVALPVVRPAEEAAGAAEEQSVRFRDRAQREMVFGAGHEASVLAVAAGLIRSYRQLPVLLYEGWQQFRDREGNAPVGGLLGAREGRVVDAYGLYHDATELAAECAQVRVALADLLAGWDLGALDVIGAEDAEGHPLAHAMVYPAEDGERTYARCPACGYTADMTAARVAQEPPAPKSAGSSTPEVLLPLQDVETPDCKTIADLAGFLGIPASRTAKVVFLVATIAGESDRFVFAVVRGDTALHETRLKAVLGAESVGPATEAEIRQAGAEPGYGSPLGLTARPALGTRAEGVTVVVDTLAARSPNLVAGANRPGYHTLNVNLGRDYQATAVAEIAAAQEGSPCPHCGSPVVLERGISLAETWQSRDPLSRDLNPEVMGLRAAYLDSSGRSLPLALGRYRVYVDRVVAALTERHHDSSGLVWPAAVAPYRVHLMTVGKASPEVTAAVERVYADLAGAGIDVLFDDRDERAGVKFNDADLLGAPWRVAVGERGLQNGAVEVKARNRPEVELVALEKLVSLVGPEL
jgi:prolyl-tRNA synthetase